MKYRVKENGFVGYVFRTKGEIIDYGYPHSALEPIIEAPLVEEPKIAPKEQPAKKATPIKDNKKQEIE